MTPRPLSLSDRQLSLVRQAAKSVPVEYRDRYLTSISDWLLGREVTRLSTPATRHRWSWEP